MTNGPSRERERRLPSLTRVEGGYEAWHRGRLAAVGRLPGLPKTPRPGHSKSRPASIPSGLLGLEGALPWLTRSQSDCFSVPPSQAASAPSRLGRESCPPSLGAPRAAACFRTFFTHRPPPSRSTAQPPSTSATRSARSRQPGWRLRQPAPSRHRCDAVRGRVPPGGWQHGGLPGSPRRPARRAHPRPAFFRPEEPFQIQCRVTASP
jgi:hypothetical protein